MTHAIPKETPQEMDVEEILWKCIDQQAKEAPAQEIPEEGEG